MSINHSSSTVISGLVFSMDAMNKKSYVGPPIKNNPTGISFAGVSTSTGYVCTGITEVIDIPQLGPTTAYTSNIQNDYSTSGNCCPSLFQYGGYAVTGSTLYTYGIVYRCQSGYTHPNFMYRYEYNGGTYVTESGVHDNAKRIHLGNGWYWAWNTFTTQPSTTQINSSGLWFYNYSTFSDKISVAKVFVTQGDYTGLHPKYWPDMNVTRSNTQAIVDLTGNNTLTANSLTYASDGTFSFNGSNDKLTLNTNTIISGTSDYTIDAAFKTSAAGTDFIFGNYGVASGASGGLEYYVYQSKLNNYIAGNTQSATTLNLNQWYIASVTRSGSTITHYLNGIADGSGTNAASISATNPFTIGNGHDYTSEAFGGTIGAIKVYNRALSAAEVAQNFQALRGRYGI